MHADECEDSIPIGASRYWPSKIKGPKKLDLKSIGPHSQCKCPIGFHANVRGGGSVGKAVRVSLEQVNTLE